MSTDSTVTIPQFSEFGKAVKQVVVSSMNSANELLKEKLTVENCDQLMTLANPKMHEFVKESISCLAFLSALWSVSQSAPLCKVWRLAYLFGIAMGVAIGSAMEAKAK